MITIIIAFGIAILTTTQRIATPQRGRGPGPPRPKAPSTTMDTTQSIVVDCYTCLRSGHAILTLLWRTITPKRGRGPGPPRPKALPTDTMDSDQSMVVDCYNRLRSGHAILCAVPAAASTVANVTSFRCDWQRVSETNNGRSRWH